VRPTAITRWADAAKELAAATSPSWPIGRDSPMQIVSANFPGKQRVSFGLLNADGLWLAPACFLGLSNTEYLSGAAVQAAPPWRRPSYILLPPDTSSNPFASLATWPAGAISRSSERRHF